MLDNHLRIAITGASGFIAKHLADRFIIEGHKVAAVPRELLLDVEALELYFKKLNPHYIFHMASYGNMSDQIVEDEIFSTNIIKTYFLLKASLSTPYSAFINVSSSSVYGAKSSPMNERDSLDTDTMYGVTKVGAEYLARYFAHKYNKPILSVRPFSVTGVGEQSQHLIPTLIRSSLKHKKMDLVSDATHDFIDVDDVVEALLLLCLEAKDHAGESFNIGTGVYWTNSQVKQIVEANTGLDIKVHMVKSMRDYDQAKWVADPIKLTMMGWHPKKDLQRSILEMVEWEKEHGNKK